MDELPGVDRTGWREFLEKHGFNVTVVDQLLGSRIHPEHVTPNQLARSKLRIWELPLGQFKCKNFTRSCWEMSPIADIASITSFLRQTSPK